MNRWPRQICPLERFCTSCKLRLIEIVPCAQSLSDEQGERSDAAADGQQRGRERAALRSKPQLGQEAPNASQAVSEFDG